ncbi:MAG: 3-deoxy-D-manno-octulosonic acid transferase [Gammaproteobacteria bacterium]|nr:3-deoxy-D-manno-octulosonic acid transferase [Gammaproteobacteria bacterium]
MLYQLFIRLLSPLIWLLILVEAFKRKTGAGFVLQRLGIYYPPATLTPNKQRIWLHCASVGEVKAAEPLILALQADHDLIITTNTPTGKAFVERLFSNQVSHYYLPMDWPCAIHRFLNQVQPDVCWILETEIWPNLYQACHKRGIAVSIINARISAKTLNAPTWLKTAYRQSLNTVSHVLARSQAEADRFIQLGADPKKVQVLGNLKYAQINTVSHSERPIKRDYILLASSHADEELEISQAWLKQNRSELFVIVPRHPKRSERIQKQLRPLDNALKVASLGETPNADTQLFLDDRLGQLMPLFEHAKLVIMGGSFVPKGGHNVLEPAAYQKAIITGPDMSDFEEETQLLLSQQGIVQCNDLSELNEQMLALITDKMKCKTLGQQAYQTVEAQKGVLARYLKTLIR